MRVVRNKRIDYEDESTGSSCEVYLIHVQIEDVDEKAKEMIKTITDTSWLNGMNAFERIGFKACSQRTIDKFVNEILSNVDGRVETDFGEIMISDTAQCVLCNDINHSRLPLADLIKERVSGNGGFDFHTESHNNRIVFGEAKYSGSITRYSHALTQINDFIKDEKDNAELITIAHFVSEDALQSAGEGFKGYTAAFSLHCSNASTIFNNAIDSEDFKSLLNNKEIYLIGVEVCD